MAYTEQAKILIVDDQKHNLKILSDILKDDATLVLAKSGEQALTKVKEVQPDLILLDIVMPEIDGFEVIKRLKADEKTRKIPVIFISALDNIESEEIGLKLGASDYIHNPFHAAIVQARVQLQLELAQQRKLLEHLANIDPLTAIANRRRYDQVLTQEWRSAQRNNQPLSMVMLDIDCFKHYNDHYGHAAGDKVLQLVVKAISSQLQRPRDFIARYGGEEFVVILPETDLPGSIKIIDDCLQAVAALEVEHCPYAEKNIVTISAGGVNLIPAENELSQQALNRADAMLYRAKAAGKNTAIWWPNH